MIVAKQRPQLLVLSTVFPGRTNGSPIALESSLGLYKEVFGRCRFVALLERAPDAYTRERFADVEFSGLAVVRGSTGVRFLKTLFSESPACAEQYLSKRVRLQVREEIDRFYANGGRHLVVEHVAPFVLLLGSKARWKDLKIALRSHDVLYDAFALLARQQRGLSRFLWQYEAARVFRLERDAVRSADALWAITSQDASTYRKVFQRACSVVDVSIDANRYRLLPPRSPLNILHIGGYDARKAQGLSWLISEVWPIVRGASIDAKLVLAGDNSNTLTDLGKGIEGLGRVPDDISFLGEGAVFVNPQQAGSGLKLKSLTAMATGKALVSTVNGVTGIDGSGGKEFFVCDSAEHFARSILLLVRDHALAEQMGVRARKFVQGHYGWSEFKERALGCIYDFSTT